MAKSKSTASSASGKPKSENAVVKYVNNTRSELRKVTWPTGEESRNLTFIITVATIAMALFLSAFDYIFQTLAAGVIAEDMVRIALIGVALLAGAAAFYFNSRDE